MDKDSEELNAVNLIQTKFDNDVDIQTIEDIVIDYVLRCIKGPYIGNFIYLNLTEEGEKIGSDPSQDLSLCIENAGLSPLHATITYEKDEQFQYKYILRDLKSYKGTWIQIRQDTPIVIKQNMVFKIENEEYLITFSDEKMDEVTQWLSRAELKYLRPHFQNAGIVTLDQLQNIQEEEMDNFMNVQEKQKFMYALEEFKQDFPDQYVNSFLEIRSMKEPENGYTVGWRGALIDTSKNKQNNDRFQVEKIDIESDSNLQLEIKYQFGCYFFMKVSQGSAYVKLDPDQMYQLAPDDQIQIGSLEFVVQRFNTGIYQHQGDRRSMEDQVVAHQDIGISVDLHVSLFAVFDGHGGDECVKFVSQQLVDNIKDLAIEEENLFNNNPSFYRFMYDILHESIQKTDIQFFEKSNNLKKTNNSGSVSTIVLIVGNILICANIGDCRAVLSQNGTAINISKDHKPHMDKEKKRIQEAGGHVELNRVNGILGVSRAFGDFVFKKEVNQFGSDIISVEPDITYWELNYVTDEFLIIACDGLYDIFSSQQCIDFVRERLMEAPIAEQDPQEVAKQLVQEIYNKQKSRKKKSDNLSLIIITFSRGVPQVTTGLNGSLNINGNNK